MTEPTPNANIHSIMAQISGYEFDLMTVRSFDYWAAEKKIDMDLAEETANGNGNGHAPSKPKQWQGRRSDTKLSMAEYRQQQTDDLYR
jgi:hypothetical protein